MSVRSCSALVLALGLCACNALLGNEEGHLIAGDAGPGRMSAQMAAQDTGGTASMESGAGGAGSGGRPAAVGVSGAGAPAAGSSPAAPPPNAGASGAAGSSRDCSSLSCGESARCDDSDSGKGAQCLCKPGFEPRDASCRDVDECATGNGGCDTHASCINLPGSRSCECQAGYRAADGSDTRCVDLCAEAGCDPHAECSLVGNEAVCQCQSPYTGDGLHCIFSESCSTIGCGANARCLDEPVRCVCSVGFEGDGKSCVAIDECKTAPCKNGGRCLDAVGGFSCDCAGSGFRGVTCEEQIDDCSPNPCVHGSCADGLNSSTCSCEDGYVGTHCEIDRDDCAAGPCVHGTCQDLVDGYRCLCTAGYVGMNCETNGDDCASQPCVRGACSDQVNGFSCACPAGYDGQTCDHNIDDCAAKPCARGTCADLVDGYKCTCPAGYDGATCDHNIDDCAKKPCLRGTCGDLVNDYKCTCPAGWKGKNCETADCASAGCPSGAPCRIANKLAICYPSACTEAGLCVAENANGSGAARVFAGRNDDWNDYSWGNRAKYFAYLSEVHGGHACVFPSANEGGTPLVIPLGQVKTRTSAFGLSNSWPSDTCVAP